MIISEYPSGRDQPVGEFVENFGCKVVKLIDRFSVSFSIAK